MIPLLVAVIAGVLTTLSGMGGGLVLLLFLSLWYDPLTALAATSPALLVGNAHRVWLYSGKVDHGVARTYALGGFIGALLGGFVALGLPTIVMQTLMIAVVAFALGRAAFGWTWRPPRGVLGAGGFTVGALAATGGGAGVLAGPLLLSTGLTGPPYVATAAAGALAMHIGRLLAYSAGGLMTTPVLVLSAGLAVALTVGNLLGDRVRAHLDDPTTARIELGTVVVCAGLALAGIQ